MISISRKSDDIIYRKENRPDKTILKSSSSITYYPRFNYKDIILFSRDDGCYFLENDEETLLTKRGGIQTMTIDRHGQYILIVSRSNPYHILLTTHDLRSKTSNRLIISESNPENPVDLTVVPFDHGFMVITNDVFIVDHKLNIIRKGNHFIPGFDPDRRCLTITNDGKFLISYDKLHLNIINIQTLDRKYLEIKDVNYILRYPNKILLTIKPDNNRYSTDYNRVLKLDLTRLDTLSLEEVKEVDPSITSDNIISVYGFTIGVYYDINDKKLKYLNVQQLVCSIYSYYDVKSFVRTLYKYYQLVRIGFINLDILEELISYIPDGPRNLTGRQIRDIVSELSSEEDFYQKLEKVFEELY